MLFVKSLPPFAKIISRFVKKKESLLLSKYFQALSLCTFVKILFQCFYFTRLMDKDGDGFVTKAVSYL